MRKFILAVTGAVSAFAALAAPPAPLVGEWEDPDRNARGTMVITITREDSPRIQGMVVLAGSENCVEPIPFRGTLSAKSFTAMSDAPIVCGYGGTLSVEAVAGNDGRYAGTFSYVWMGKERAKGVLWFISEKR